jgi:hypothetical protein
MGAFEYLSVLLSIILGLAITQVLGGFRGLMQSRRRTRAYAPAVTWAVLVLVIAVQGWWSMFDLRRHEEWTFLEFAIVLAQTIVEYLLAALVLPDFVPGEHVDLEEHYHDHRRWFFGLLVALVLVSVVKSLVVYRQWLPPADAAFHAVFLAMGIAGALLPGRRAHAAFAVLGSLAIGTYIALLFTRLH